jgi:acyl transferase domain-containing protein/acyl carrier protein
MSDNSNPAAALNFRQLLQEAWQEIRYLREQLATTEVQVTEPIALIGMDCRFPGGANSPEAYWELLQSGRDAICDIPADRWSITDYYDPDPDRPGKMYVRAGGFLDQVDQFDPQFFGISPREAHALDPQQRLLLEVCHTALERAGQAPDRLRGSQTAVIVGIGFEDYAKFSLHSGDPSRIDPFSSLGNTRSIAVGRVSYVLGLQGPTLQLDTTCSSSLLAVHLACQSLRAGEATLALAGGVNLMLAPEPTIGFCKLKALAADGRCKPFDASANGYVRGEGCGIVVLKRLRDAIADRDPILAVIRGSAVNHDGQSNGLTAPNGAAQTAVIRQAIAAANIKPQQIDYVETHGTGTSLGDPIEVIALNEALGRDRVHKLTIGSVKANIGHLEAAAGVASLIKVVLALQHRQIPPQIHLQTPNPHIPWQKFALTVPTQLTPWEARSTPRLAGISSFGMSGTNVHVIVSEPEIESDRSRSPDRPLHCLALSAKTIPALQALAQNYLKQLDQPETSLADLCYSANCGRSHFDYRLCVVAQSLSELREKLQRRDQFTRATRPKIAYLFTGQGSQFAGMGWQLYHSQPVFRRAIDQCATLFQPYLNFDLRDILYATEQASDLTPTIQAQPALFALEYALYQLWQAWGIQPDVVLGHSLGEYVAAWAAGVFSLEDAIKLVATRAKLMQALPPTGQMVAVRAAAPQVAPALTDFTGRATIAVINSPSNTVISGETAAIAQLVEHFAAQGISTQPLAVSHAFHSPLMQPMIAEFERVASTVQYSAPKLELIANVTGDRIQSEIATAEYWCRQILQPVRFAEGIQTLKQFNCQIALEIGPKPVLLNLGRQCLPDASIHWLPSLNAADRSQKPSEANPRGTDSQSPPILGDLGGKYSNSQSPPILGDLGGKYSNSQSPPILGDLGGKYSNSQSPPILGDLGGKYSNSQSPPILGDLGGKYSNSQSPPILGDLGGKYSNSQSPPILGDLGGKYSDVAISKPFSNQTDFSDWQTLLSSLAALYEQGAAIDWQAFDRDYARQHVPIPTYPFQKQRYWVEPSPSRSVPAAGHPLLGQRFTPAKQSAIYFAQELQPDRPDFLQDHRVFGEVILPAAAYLEMAIAAGTQVFQTPAIALTEFTIHQALVLQPDRATSTQVVITPEAAQTGTIEIFQLQANADWVLHASGKLAVTDTIHQPSIDLAQKINCCPEIIENFYSACAERGIEYGAQFQAITKLQVGDRLAIGQICLPRGVVNSADYRLHPVLLDACLQVTGAILPTEQTYLPIRLQQFSVAATAADEVWSLVTLHNATTSILTADIQILTATGQIIAQITGLQLQPATAKPTSDAWQDWLYQVEWRSQALPLPKGGRDDTNASAATPEAIRQTLLPIVAQQMSSPELLAYEQRLQTLETLSLGYIEQAFQQLGGSWTVGAEFTTAEAIAQFAVVSQYQRLLHRLLQILAEAGRLQQIQPDRWRVQSEVQSGARLQAAEGEIELILLDRCGSRLAAVLQGRQDAVELLFPDGDLSLLTQLYQSSPGTKQINQQAQQVITTALASISDRPLRILEIGAGTGGTTAAVLPHLNAATTTYIFTDISPLFLHRAQQQFAAYPFVEYHLLDIERSPRLQGFEQPFDLVLAANVLHATPDLQQTLTHVRQLLSPEGLLVLIEGTRSLRWLDLIFGLTDGWWRFQDSALRPDYPLISVPQWQQVLRQCGFESSISLTDDSESLLQQQAVIIAQADRAPANRQPWVILSDQQGVAQALTAQLTAQGQTCLCVDAMELVDTADPEAIAQFRQQLPVAPRGLIHLCSLDVTAPDLDTAAAGLARSCRTALVWLQSLLQANWSAPPALYFVTQGAVAIDLETPLTGVWQAGVWGMSKTLGLEHSEIKRVCVDLDPTQSAIEQARELSAELLANSPETEVVWRGGQRSVARLVKRSGFASNQCLTISQRGSLDTLTLTAIERRSPDPHELELRVLATGLNFRDVLNALGLYPGDAGALGCECVGEVVSIGDAVTDFQVGDIVLAIAAQSFSQFVTVDRRLVIPKPAHLSVPEAATLPVAFLTAFYALHSLAQIQPGDRVLIHAAAGGVGQALVQLALQAGAEVFATASPEKWEAVRSLGVAQVFNSRTAEFAAQIRALTQGEGVEIVVNSLAGELLTASVALLKPQGRFIELGKQPEWNADRFAALQPQAHYFPVDLVELCQQQPDLIQSLLQTLRPQFDRALKPLPYTEFSLPQVREAFRFMQQANHIGKVIVTHSSPHSRDTTAQTSPQTPVANIRPDRTYLITGGLGGLGLLVADWLVQQGAKHLLLLSRRPANANAQAQIQSWEQAGVTVQVAPIDVTARSQLAAVLADLPLPLGGVIHAAGMLDDANLHDLTWKQMTTVLAPKVVGAWNLHHLTLQQPIDFFVLFSSATALLGSPGQANHVAANVLLDQFAHYRRQMNLPALSINWGIWSEVGAAAARRADSQLQTRGIGSIAPSQGLASLAHLLGSDAVQCAVMPLDWSRFLRLGQSEPFWSEVRSPSLSQSPAEVPFLEQLRAADDRPAFLLRYLQTQLAQVLGFAPDDIDPNQGFFDLGMDSLTAVEFKSRLQTSLGCPLTSTLAFDYPTIQALADYLAMQPLAAYFAPEPTDRVEESIVPTAPDLDDIAAQLAQELLAIEQGKAR